jgi:curved DNA-binding protein CbpA
VGGGGSGGGEQRPLEELSAVLQAMRAQNHFEVLGVNHDASGVEINAAYERVAREFHPDRFRFRPEDTRIVAMKIFDRLTDALAVLRDGTRRRRYLNQVERERALREEEDTGLESMRRGAPDTAAEQVYFSGVEHLRARRYHEAVHAFRQAASLAPGQASYRGALGWALFRQAPTSPEALQSGLLELRRAVEMDPFDPWVRISLGRFFAETGYADEAIHEFEAALRLNPGLNDIEEEVRRLRGHS